MARRSREGEFGKRIESKDGGRRHQREGCHVFIIVRIKKVPRNYKTDFSIRIIKTEKQEQKGRDSKEKV
jgi:hypothetical protein